MDNIIGLVKPFLPERIELILRRIRHRYQCIRQKRFKPYIRKKNVEGVVFNFLIGDITGRQWYDTTDSDWNEMRFIRDHLIQPGDVILECGAHHGCATIVFSNWVGHKGQIIAFEPVPKNAYILQKNIELNDRKNIILERKAVGPKTGRCHISGESNSLVSTRGRGIEVDMIRLDEYEHFHPTFLKIDVEGFEIEVLKGAKNILATKPKLDIEIHTRTLKHYGSSAKNVFDFIKTEEYELWILCQDENEPRMYDMKKPIRGRVHLFAIPKH